MRRLSLFGATGSVGQSTLDLIRRDEFEILKAEIASLRAEIAALKGAEAPKKAPKKA